MSHMTGAPAASGWFNDPAGSGQLRYYDGEQWTEHYSPTPPQHVQPSAAPPKKRPRIFMWVFLAIQALFLVWIIGGIASGSGTPKHCGSLSQHACNTAANVGTGIGVALIVGLWIVVDFLLGVTYLIVRLARR
jgi:Protein of unknown function (DUF2510)